MAEKKSDESTQSASATDSTAKEDLKRKFREALEKKNSHGHAHTQASGGTKITHAHGSESSVQDFRRKSG